MGRVDIPTQDMSGCIRYDITYTYMDIGVLGPWTLGPLSSGHTPHGYCIAWVVALLLVLHNFITRV